MSSTTNQDIQNGPKPVRGPVTSPPPVVATGATGATRPGYSGTTGSTAAAAAPIVEHLADRYGGLKRACYELLDNIKKRAPKEDRRIWRCPDFQRICNLIDFK